MRVVKINAVWCSGCLIMNKVWKSITEKYEIETTELDYDIDEEEVEKYNPGNVLPVFIFFEDDEEILRIVGEVRESEMLEKIKEVGELREKIN